MPRPEPLLGWLHVFLSPGQLSIRNHQWRSPNSAESTFVALGRGVYRTFSALRCLQKLSPPENQRDSLFDSRTCPREDAFSPSRFTASPGPGWENARRSASSAPRYLLGLSPLEAPGTDLSTCCHRIPVSRRRGRDTGGSEGHRGALTRKRRTDGTKW